MEKNGNDPFMYDMDNITLMTFKKCKMTFCEFPSSFLPTHLFSNKGNNPENSRATLSFDLDFEVRYLVYILPWPMILPFSIFQPTVKIMFLYQTLK